MHFSTRRFRYSVITLLTTTASIFSAEPISIGLDANQMSIATGQPSLVMMSSGSIARRLRGGSPVANRRRRVI